MRILTTLLIPDAGRAKVDGIDVVADPQGVRTRIGLTGQYAAVDERLTGRENMQHVARLFHLPKPEIIARSDELLERFDLVDAADRLVKGYSGGMRRRLDISMSLIARQSVLFLDEPTTGLDPEARALMWAEIERLAGAEGMTILLTTHYLEEADRLASELAIVDRGRIVARGTPDALKDELEGDAVQVELSQDEGGAAQAALERVGGLGDVLVEGRTLHARAADGAAAIPAVLAALEAHGVRAASVTLARPSLDDVYLRHAGRSYAA